MFLMKDSGILEIEIKYIKIHEGKNFSGINLRQNRVAWQGWSLRLFNRHSTSCTLGGRPIFLSPLFFRTYLSEPSPALTIATHDCFPSTHKVLPSLSTRFIIIDAHTHKRARGEIDIKDKEGGSAQGQGVKREICLLRFTDARAWLMLSWMKGSSGLLALGRSGSMVHRKRLVTPCFRLRARYYL